MHPHPPIPHPDRRDHHVGWRFLVLCAAVGINLGWPIPLVQVALAATAIVAMLALRPRLRDFEWSVLTPLGMVAALLLLQGWIVPGRTVWSLGPIQLSHEGLVAGRVMAGRVGVALLWLLWFRLGVTVEGLCRCLRTSPLPRDLADLMQLMLRYLALLGEEAARLTLAARTRGGFARPWPALQTTASICAAVLIGAYDRGERIGLAMALRGDGAPPPPDTAAPPPPPRVELTGLTFRYPTGYTALHDLTLTIPQGDVLAVLGANGSGKTTLLKVLCGVLPPSAGEARISGRTLRAWRGHLWREVGLVMQDPCDQVVSATVDDDVAFGPRNLQLPEAEVRQRVDEALETLEITALRHAAVRTLSYGQLKRVAIAGVLAMRPAVLLLDEPTAGLDPHCADDLLVQLRRLQRERGLTIVFTTHDVDRAARLADRVAVLAAGHLRCLGTPREVFTDPQLAASGLRPPAITEYWQQTDADPPAPVTVEEAVARLRARS